jgi:hypothetical protein
VKHIRSVKLTINSQLLSRKYLANSATIEVMSADRSLASESASNASHRNWVELIPVAELTLAVIILLVALMYPRQYTLEVGQEVSVYHWLSGNTCYDEYRLISTNVVNNTATFAMGSECTTDVETVVIPLFQVNLSVNEFKGSLPHDPFPSGLFLLRRVTGDTASFIIFGVAVRSSAIN